jgi:predicted aminopeptidase
MKSGLRIVVVAMLLALTGCAHVGYYLQSIGGQVDIWNRERAIDEVIADPETPAALREKLAAVQRIREFASRELGLTDNASFRRYADLGRPFVVWNVFAAPEFSTKPVQWCFPVAGCVGYRGYFAKADAEDFAAVLAAGGDDVYVGGVPAYSTLGWFADPVLNTFVRYPDPGIARLIFHELAHQVVYVRNDSVFNESFAVTVAREGIRRWLERHGTAQDKSAYARMRRQREDFVRLIQAYRVRLDALYASGLAPQAMRGHKRELFEAMTRDYEKLKAGWNGFAGYDRWFAQRPNNAQIASVTIYTQRVPAFQALLEREGRDLPRFYLAVRELAGLDKQERTRSLDRLLAPTAASGAGP